MQQGKRSSRAPSTQRVGAPCVLVAALACACAHLPSAPDEGGPAWTEWTSPHFRLLTDVTDEGVAEHLATQLEQFRAAILAAAWRDVPEPKDLLEVIALRNAFETDAVLPPHAIAEFVPLGGLDFIVLSATEHVGRAKTVKHETVHALMHQLGLDRNAPVWFGEGIAEYLAMTDFDENTDKITFGSWDPDYLRAVHRIGLADWDELWAPHALDIEKFRQVSTSWLLVHYLFNHERERFSRYQVALAGAKDAKALWREVFPELGRDELYDRLSVYATDGEYVKVTAQIPEPHFGLVERAVTHAEVHAILGMLNWSASGHEAAAGARAHGEIAEALGLDPMNVRARFVERVLMHQGIEDLKTAESLTHEHPDDWRAWLVLAAAHAANRQERETQAALAKAHRLGFPEREAPGQRVASPY
jgi:hypothetical protein